MAARRTILVVDDEAGIRAVAAQCLQGTHDVRTANDAAGGLEALADDPCDVLLTDVYMPGGGGRELVNRALDLFPDLAVIVMSGRGTVDDVIAFLRLGVLDFIQKPFTPQQLRLAVARALELRHLRAENRDLRRRLSGSSRPQRLLGESPVIEATRQALAQVAPTEATVLITGASGTGKELAARTVHDLSQRSGRPFVAVHCGALPANLLESELFGHVRGAFTGAERARCGRFEEADGGSLFLDEVGTMAEDTQVRLLRALGNREVTRVGNDTPTKVDVRVIAATNADLEAATRAGRFREDLYYRLNVFPIRMPDLKERADDLPLLADHFLDLAGVRLGRPAKRLSQAARNRLRGHDWPGNVRELENVIERAMILSGDADVIGPDCIVLGGAGTLSTARDALIELPQGGLDLAAVMARAEAGLIAQALERTGDNRARAAALLGLQRTTLVEKLRRREPAAGRREPPATDASSEGAEA